MNSYRFLHQRSKQLSLCLCFIVVYCTALTQSRLDSLFNKIDPQKWSATVEKRVSRLEEKIVRKSLKALDRLQKQEERAYRKLLSTKDSIQAKQRLTEIQNKYASLRQQLKSPVEVVSANTVKNYIPYLDTLNTACKFLNNANVLSKVQSLQGRIEQADDIKDFIRERREQLQQQLGNVGMVKELKKFNKEAYYYAAQVKEYKKVLSDPKKIERKAIEILSKTKLFQDFMRKNSMLASLFRMPGGDLNDLTYQASLAGLQTRSQVNNIIQQQISSGGPNAQAQFQQNIQQAQSQLQQLKNKVLKGGGQSSNDQLPDFKPNQQKTKSFLQRLEYGTNVQTQRASSFFPVTSDVGLSVGYKLNDKSIIGIGASYKLGWGRGWNNIKLTNEGAGLRGFLDWKIKGSFWISGGYEMNYKASFSDFDQLRNLNAWQQSGLVGLSKVVAVKSNFFKKTKLQLLWDFLSYQQVPRTQPVVFRIGYNIR